MPRFWTTTGEPLFSIPSVGVCVLVCVGVCAYDVQSLCTTYRTFTTDYAGAILEGCDAVHPARFEVTDQRIDRTLLLERAPILFSAEIPLYESEMDDNGVSSCTVRVCVFEVSCTVWDQVPRYFHNLGLIVLCGLSLSCCRSELCLSAGSYCCGSG